MPKEYIDRGKINHEETLKWLYGMLRKKRMALGRAEKKPNVGTGEIESLKSTIEVIEWLIGVVLERKWEET